MYLARDIPTFLMYCVYGESRSSLLIEYRLYDIAKIRAVEQTRKLALLAIILIIIACEVSFYIVKSKAFPC